MKTATTIEVGVTEINRSNAQSAAMSAALDRILLQAQNGGSLKEIAREVESVNGFVVAIGAAQNDDEIDELVRVRNSI